MFSLINMVEIVYLLFVYLLIFFCSGDSLYVGLRTGESKESLQQKLIQVKAKRLKLGAYED